jgi:enamine deaminase RidA (YjgF/YER057c/UK114 family)
MGLFDLLPAPHLTNPPAPPSQPPAPAQPTLPDPAPPEPRHRPNPVPGDRMPPVPRQLITGHSPYEPLFGFSRAVVSGDRVLVAGTAPVPPGGGPPPSEPYAQARLCIDLIGEALTQAGTDLEHVIRTRMFLTDPAHWREVARAHGDVFAEIRPAATAVIVAALLDPAWQVEIEAEAVLPDR